MPSDYYALLGIGRDASPEEIKQGYKKMAMKWHPDKHASASDEEQKLALEKFQEVAQAYDTLSDAKKKDIYDCHGESGLKRPDFGVGPSGFGAIDPMDLFYQMFEHMKDPHGVNGDTASKKEQRAASEAYKHGAGRDDDLPPAGLRFAFDGAAYHEGAVLHGLAAPYEGLFRLSKREVHGKPAYRHAVRGERWIAFNGSGWMAQNESALGSKSGVLLLKDKRCRTPDASPLSWHASPGWQVQPGLRVVAMSEQEADRWEAQSNPFGEMAAVNEAIGIMNQVLSLDPVARVARDPSAPTAKRLEAMDQLQQQRRGQQHGHAGRAIDVSDDPNPFDARNRGGGRGGGRGRGRGSGRGGDGRARLTLGGGTLYVGCVCGPSGTKPHGAGELLLKDGSVHTGLFEGGGAHGGGVYYDRKGSVHIGSWAANLRVGVFEVVDSTGAFWEDVYDQAGKRTSHKKKGDGPGSAADFCKLCGVKFHGAHNYACRRHVSEFDGVRWACCGAASLEEPGCHVEAAHEA